jgi:hypothetical protein
MQCSVDTLHAMPVRPGKGQQTRPIRWSLSSGQPANFRDMLFSIQVHWSRNVLSPHLNLLVVLLRPCCGINCWYFRRRQWWTRLLRANDLLATSILMSSSLKTAKISRAEKYYASTLCNAYYSWVIKSPLHMYLHSFRNHMSLEKLATEENIE